MKAKVEPKLSFIQNINQNGIPLPLIRIKGKSSFTGTLVFLSFNLCLLGHIGKITKLIGDVDMNSAQWLFGSTLVAFVGNKKLNQEDLNTTQPKAGK